MKIEFHSLLIFLLMILFSVSLHARTYQVEVLVFSNKNSISFEEEFFRSLSPCLLSNQTILLKGLLMAV